MPMRTILIAEDNEHDIFLMRRCHERSGLNCTLQFVKDGDAAIEYLSNQQQRKPRFVLLDIKMPRRNGHEVLNWIRSQADTAHLPVVMFSSSSEPTDIRRAYRSGANSYLVKSPDLDVLAETLRLLVRYWVDSNVTD